MNVDSMVLAREAKRIGTAAAIRQYSELLDSSLPGRLQYELALAVIVDICRLQAQRGTLPLSLDINPRDGVDLESILRQEDE